jgi:hypothetical protein
VRHSPGASAPASYWVLANRPRARGRIMAQRVVSHEGEGRLVES